MARRKNTATTEENTVTAPAAFDPRAVSVGESDMDFKSTSTRDKYADNPFVGDVRKSKEIGKPLGIDVAHSQVGEITAWLRDAARKADLGLSVRYRYNTVDEEGNDGTITVGQVNALPADESDYPVHVAFMGKTAKATTARDRVECPDCKTEKSVNADGTIRNHKNPNGDGQCPGSGLQTTTEEDSNTENTDPPETGFGE